MTLLIFLNVLLVWKTWDGIFWYFKKQNFSLDSFISSKIIFTTISHALIGKVDKRARSDLCLSEGRSWLPSRVPGSIYYLTRKSDVTCICLLFDLRRNTVASFRGMHVSPAKHSYAWLPRKCDYRTDRRTDTGHSDPYMPLCFAGDTKRKKSDYVLLQKKSLCHQKIKKDRTT